MIAEKIHGLGPLRPATDKQSSLVGSMTEALWYVADGRPYEELMAATCNAFVFCASPEVACPGRWIERCPDVALPTASRSAGLDLIYHETPEGGDTTGPEWLKIRQSMGVALEDRRPVLCRGGWADRLTHDWGVLTGFDSAGLPAGHCWTGGQQSVEALIAPPTQLIFFGRELSRPGARELTLEILRNAILALDGTISGHVVLGRSWAIGPDALHCWAERLEGNGPFCSLCDSSCLEQLRAHYRDTRRWAGRYLSDTAALRLGKVRPARAIGKQFRELAESLATPDRETLAAAVRQAARTEVELARQLGELIGQ